MRFIDCIPSVLHCLFTEKQNGRVIAHCLDFDLVAGASTLEEAEGRLEALIKNFLEITASNENVAALSHRAPMTFWTEFQAAWSGGQHVDPAHKTLTVRIPSPGVNKKENKLIPLLYLQAAA